MIKVDEELRHMLRKLVIKMWLMSLAALGLGAVILISTMYLIIYIIKLVCG